MSVSRNELIREMCKAIGERNAAVFGGAGLSRGSGYVDWKEFLRPIAADIDLNVEKEQDLLAVAQYYRNKRGTGNLISQKIMDAFNTDAEINENIRILTRLPIFTYWTTNYDSLIEDGLKQANRNPDVKSEPEQLTVSKRDRDAIVYKMHGDAAKPACAVLTKNDYEMYEQERPLFRTALKGDLISKTFLFVGFSFEDPNLDYILGQIRSLLGENIHDHYCFLKRVQRKDYKRKENFGYDKAKQDYREEDLKRYGIQTCFVDSYDEITDILREIEAAVRKKNVFISGSAEEFGTSWRRETAEGLASRLASDLVKMDCRITSGFGLGIGSSVINSALDVIYSSKFRHTDEYLSLRPFPQNISDPAERKRRYTKYREEMLEDVGIAIFMFGNKKVKDPVSGKERIVPADGCREEYEIARKSGKIIIPIGSTGNVAREIFNEMKATAAKYPYLNGHWDVLENETDVDKLAAEVVGIVKQIQLS